MNGGSVRSSDTGTWIARILADTESDCYGAALAARDLRAERLNTGERSFAGLRSVTALCVRVVAFWFGLCCLLNVIGNLRHPAFDANLWWMDLRSVPGGGGDAFMALLGAVLISAAIGPAMRRWRRALTLSVIAVATAAVITNVVTYYRSWGSDRIQVRTFVPLSVLIAGLLAAVVLVALRPPPPTGPRVRIAVVLATSAVFAVAMPVLQMAFFGTTDYRRPADAIVVFGARVDSGGKASIVLADRVTTATELYQEGLASTIVMSGGVEPSGYDETAVMRDLAIAQGVPADAIVVDQGGISTQASVDDTTALFQARGFRRVLAVSQFYHLPRIKLAYARAGWDVWTVPSRDTPVARTRVTVLREIPAFWAYYLRAVIS
jgi:vancomycin permeability regulator SanA